MMRRQMTAKATISTWDDDAYDWIPYAEVEGERANIHDLGRSDGMHECQVRLYNGLVDVEHDPCSNLSIVVANPLFNVARWPSLEITGFVHVMQVATEPQTTDGSPSYTPDENPGWKPSLVKVRLDATDITMVEEDE